MPSASGPCRMYMEKEALLEFGDKPLERFNSELVGVLRHILEYVLPIQIECWTKLMEELEYLHDIQAHLASSRIYEVSHEYLIAEAKSDSQVKIMETKYEDKKF
ncbi:hypothetical protein TrVFT333_008183 [Trichoderma virens FT-333]|nr:hypothetical protein TrVFT333_008183 [Trichoderma virens FT-333]